MLITEWKSRSTALAASSSGCGACAGKCHTPKGLKVGGQNGVGNSVFIFMIEHAQDLEVGLLGSQVKADLMETLYGIKYHI